MVANTTDMTGSIYHERQVSIKYFMFLVYTEQRTKICYTHMCNY